MFIWRHVVRRVPLRYHPSYWAMVFPLGMYTACTFRLAYAIDAPFLLAIPRVFIYVALVAWSLTAFGLVHSLTAATGASGAKGAGGARGA